MSHVRDQADTQGCRRCHGAGGSRGRSGLRNDSRRPGCHPRVLPPDYRCAPRHRFRCASGMPAGREGAQLEPGWTDRPSGTCGPEGCGWSPGPAGTGGCGWSRGPAGTGGALAYAHVNADGTIDSHSGNITVQRIYSGSYCIGVTGGTPHVAIANLDALMNVGGSVQTGMFMASSCPANARHIFVITRSHGQDGGSPGTDRAFYIIVN